ncbi:MAG: N-acetyl-alpha-D-glucosaminyl L-malate synthase BshA [Deltaproteobacteria bacterium]|nr:MAG: N-acetyl-alpha-D-glucosaminyl L-malate synthase BshA [Deltaproteobacteria bacterium]
MNQNPLQLAFVCNPKMGGSGILATELAKGLARRGHQVHLVAESKPFAWSDELHSLHFHRVEVNDSPVFESSPHVFSLAGTLAQLLESYHIDIIHAHYAVPYGASALLAMQCSSIKAPLITTLHGTDISDLSHDPALYQIIKNVLFNSAQVTCVSDDLVRRTQSIYHLPRMPVMIPNFVTAPIDLDISRAELRLELGLVPERKYLVHISNFRPLKRIQDIIKILTGLDDDSDIHLLLVGDGTEMAACKKLAAELNLDDRITFAGPSKIAWKWLAAADINLQMSEYESFGLTLIEAMASGTPSIGTQTGGMPQVLGDTGATVKVGDYRAAAALITQWLAQPEKLQQRRAACRQRAKDCFSLEIVANQYEQLYYHHII